MNEIEIIVKDWEEAQIRQNREIDIKPIVEIYKNNFYYTRLNKIRDYLLGFIP